MSYIVLIIIFPTTLLAYHSNWIPKKKKKISVLLANVAFLVPEF